MKLSITILSLFIVLVGGQTYSQDKMQKPAPKTERGKLEFLVGSFTTATQIPPTPSAPKGATGKGTSVISWALDSMFLMIEEQSMNPLFGQYKGHGVLGYDAQSRQFTLSMYNNFGDHPSYKGDFVNDTLVLQTNVPMPGHPFDQRLLWYKEGNTVKLKVMNDFGKGFLLSLEETVTPTSQQTK